MQLGRNMNRYWFEKKGRKKRNKWQSFFFHVLTTAQRRIIADEDVDRTRYEDLKWRSADMVGSVLFFFL